MNTIIICKIELMINIICEFIYESKTKTFLNQSLWNSVVDPQRLCAQPLGGMAAFERRFNASSISIQFVHQVATISRDRYFSFNFVQGFGKFHMFLIAHLIPIGLCIRASRMGIWRVAIE